jgi:hypothetical protein
MVVHFLAANNRKDVVGCGVLLPKGRIITCGHVINLVAGRPKTCNLRLLKNRDLPILVKFSTTQGRPSATCRILKWRCPNDGDVALLEVVGEIPPEAIPGYLSPQIQNQIKVHLFDFYGGTGQFVEGIIGRQVKDGYFEVRIDQQIEEGSSGGPVLRADTDELIGLIGGIGESGSQAYVIPAIRFARLFCGPLDKGSIDWRVNYIRSEILGKLNADIQRASDRGFNDECEKLQAALGHLLKVTDHLKHRTFWADGVNRDLQIYLAQYIKWNNLSGQTPEVIQQRVESAKRLSTIRKNLSKRMRTHIRWLGAEADEQVLTTLFREIKMLVDTYPVTFRSVHQRINADWPFLV